MDKQDSGNVEIFTQESVITLYDEAETPYEFFEIASIEYEGKFYELLQPVDKIEGIDEDEAVIFEYAVDTESGEKLFKPIFDQKLLESVFSLYISAAADYESTECGCGCAHEHHHHGCESDCDCDDGAECADDCDCGCHDEKKSDKPTAKKSPAAKKTTHKNKK